MEFQYLEAKNGEKTVKINNFLLHSLYSPTKEAQRFVENLNFDYKPSYIFITEPGLGYCIPFLHENFPESKIVIIRYVKAFNYSENFVVEINFSDFNSPSFFENFINSTFSELDILQATYLSWPASEKIFEQLNLTVWNSLKNIINQAKTILYTRGFFENRWLKNSVSNLTLISKTVQIINKTNKDILIIASGSSLHSAIKIIKQYKNDFFIICVSSAIGPLVYNFITPDLCISTDGGFWAKKHLEAFSKIKDTSILAIPMEAACQNNLIVDSTILPLSYEDGISCAFEKLTNITFFSAKRNGTVSGTALKLAQQLTEKNIYFFGLDLHSQKGFQHEKPNKLEIEKNIKSNKIKNLSSLNINGELNSGNLTTYENWFKVQNLNNVYRIIDNPLNSLGKIVDISTKSFEEICKKKKTEKTKVSVFSSPIILKSDDKKIYIEKFIQYINDNSNSEKWIKNEFPLDFVSLQHSKTEEEKNKIKEKIIRKNNELVEKLLSICKLV